MPGLGTLVNVIAIIVGGLCGLVSGRLFKERYCETIMKAAGFAIIVMALGGALSQMLSTREISDIAIAGSLGTQGILMMILSIVLGAFFGELINLEGLFERFGSWLKVKTGNQSDSEFVNAFVTASLCVCVGAMAIIGSVQDGISGNHEILFAKAILDFFIILIMTTTMGKGCIFSALPVAILQGLFTLLAVLVEPLFTNMVLSNISLVGNVLIMCVGINIVWPHTIRVANLLPALLFAIPFAYLF